MAVTVKAHPSEDPLKFLKRFRRVLDKSGVMQECRDRQFYTKPSQAQHQLDQGKQYRLWRQRQEKDKGLSQHTD